MINDLMETIDFRDISTVHYLIFRTRPLLHCVCDFFLDIYVYYCFQI